MLGDGPLSKTFRVAKLAEADVAQLLPLSGQGGCSLSLVASIACHHIALNGFSSVIMSLLEPTSTAAQPWLDIRPSPTRPQTSQRHACHESTARRRHTDQVTHALARTFDSVQRMRQRRRRAQGDCFFKGSTKSQHDLIAVPMAIDKVEITLCSLGASQGQRRGNNPATQVSRTFRQPPPLSMIAHKVY